MSRGLSLTVGSWSEPGITVKDLINIEFQFLIKETPKWPHNTPRKSVFESKGSSYWRQFPNFTAHVWIWWHSLFMKDAPFLENTSFLLSSILPFLCRSPFPFTIFLPAFLHFLLPCPLSLLSFSPLFLCVSLLSFFPSLPFFHRAISWSFVPLSFPPFLLHPLFPPGVPSFNFLLSPIPPCFLLSLLRLPSFSYVYID